MIRVTGSAMFGCTYAFHLTLIAAGYRDDIVPSREAVRHGVPEPDQRQA